MPGTNITWDEARERRAVVLTERGEGTAARSGNGLSYAITLDLTKGDTTFVSTTTVKFRATEGATTWLDLIAPKVRKVVLNDVELPVDEVFDGFRITLPNLAAANQVKVVAEAAYMTTGEGLHRFVDPVDDAVYLYSQFQVADARRVFACFDQPDLKGTFTFTVDAPPEWVVVSNGTPTTSSPRKTAQRWKFTTTPVMSTYITAIVAGPYHHVTDAYEGTGGTIPLGLYCRRSLADHLDADELFDLTKRGFGYFEDAFGLAYPFEKYDQLFVPEFNAGAMENAGAVTHHEDYVFRSRVTDAAYERRAETILHEMAHMWFGDLVTMAWWNDLWLNESFATWASVLCEAEATRWTQAWTTFAVSEKLWALRQDQLPSTHPVAAHIRDLEDVEVNFDGITYAKGAAVLKQLVAWVGREEFLAGIGQYFTKHAWGNTELTDLFDELNATSGRDLAAWGREWLQSAGVNTLRPVVAVDADGRYTSVRIEQTATAEHPTLRSHRVAIGLYDRVPADDDAGTGERRSAADRAGAGFVRRDRIELDLTGPLTEVPALVGAAQPDLLLVNDDDLTFAKVRLDDRSQESVIAHIAELPSLPRALCWTAATDMLRDAELATRDYVDLVLAGAQHESALSVVQYVLAMAKSAIDTYADPENRLLLTAKWASGLHRMAHDAEPGSDHQLAFVRAWAASAASPEHVAEIRALLDGSADVLPGLTVDADLRWFLVQRLVIIGAAGDELIDAELARDDTASGARHAAQARAARPNPDAKAEAWLAAVESDALPNAILAATVRGFAPPEQRHLIRPYVSRYLEAVPKVWADRTNESAQTVVAGLFPRVLADVETATMVREWLETVDLPAGPRRLVTEGLADIERALRAQAHDHNSAVS